MSNFDDQFQINSEYNRVIFIGKLDIRRARNCLQIIDQVILVKGFTDIVYDFTDLTFTHPPAMLMIISHAIRRAKEGVDSQIALPKDEALARLFLNSNWAHLLCPSKYPLSKGHSAVHIPAKKFTTPKEQSAAVNEVVDTLLTNLKDFTRDHLRAVEWSVNEITDNVLVHSGSEDGGIIQVTTQTNRKRVEFVVVDSGTGVAQTLRSAHNSIGTDVVALAKAIEEGFTRDKSIGQGNGLYGSYRIAVNSLGNFSIHANRATLYYTEKSGLHSKKEYTEFRGSLIVCGIDYTNPLLLEEALNFGGTPYVPPDFIEAKYETEVDGEIIFSMKAEAESLGSRESGRPIRNKLNALLRLSNAHRVIIDMADIHLVSSSFADEVFGKLFAEIGPVQFSSMFQLRNTDSTVKQIIDKAIMQRMVTSYSS